MDLNTVGSIVEIVGGALNGVFMWLVYASGYAEMLVKAAKANHWGFTRKSKKWFE